MDPSDQVTELLWDISEFDDYDTREALLQKLRAGFAQTLKPGKTGTDLDQLIDTYRATILAMRVEHLRKAKARTIEASSDTAEIVDLAKFRKRRDDQE